MDDKKTTAVVQVLVALTGVAILAALLSKQSNTTSLFGAFGQTVSRMFCVALSPITGGNCGGREPIFTSDSTITFDPNFGK